MSLPSSIRVWAPLTDFSDTVFAPHKLHSFDPEFSKNLDIGKFCLMVDRGTFYTPDRKIVTLDTFFDRLKQDKSKMNTYQERAQFRDDVLNHLRSNLSEYYYYYNEETPLAVLLMDFIMEAPIQPKRSELRRIKLK